MSRANSGSSFLVSWWCQWTVHPAPLTEVKLKEFYATTTFPSAMAYTARHVLPPFGCSRCDWMGWDRSQERFVLSLPYPELRFRVNGEEDGA